MFDFALRLLHWVTCRFNLTKGNNIMANTESNGLGEPLSPPPQDANVELVSP